MSDERVWYFAMGGDSVGPMSLEELVNRLDEAEGPATMVYGPGTGEWIEARRVADVAARMGSGSAPPPPPSGGRRADEIDYEIFGAEMQYVEITLDPQEMVLAEAGGMMYMTAGIEMETVFGDPSRKQSGFIDKLMSAGKRALTGESLFMTTFFNRGAAQERVAFAAPYPGNIIPVDLMDLGGEIICQKDAFLCAARGVEIGIAFQKRIGVGLFGGEGFIMQRLTGDGQAMLHAGGTLKKVKLAAGETLRVDTGCIVALHKGLGYDIQFVKGIKNIFFGGEGLFYATLTGPGEAWLQSLPFARLSGRVLANASGLGGKGEGSILGGLFLGDG